MGWTSSKDMSSEVRLTFSSLEQAEKFAKSNQWTYEIIEPLKRKFIKKSYADNFTGPLPMSN